LSAARIILDLCGGTGAWSAPYAEAGYDVRLVTLPEQDVRLYQPPANVHGVLCAPPCRDLAASGARWWAAKGERAFLAAIALADACCRVVLLCRPAWWCLENPVGRLSRVYGPPVMTFNPCDYGDPWTKRTCLWGRFALPGETPVEAVRGSRMHRMSPSADRQKLRSITPPGFARAFFEANP